jgi:hypothetical protein
MRSRRWDHDEVERLTFFNASGPLYNNPSTNDIAVQGSDDLGDHGHSHVPKA